MDLALMKKLCHLNKEQLYSVLNKFLKERYEKVIAKPTYIIAEGTLPICLIAHMDTVFKSTPREDDFIYDPEKTVLWAPGGSGFDDRAGVYSIIELVLRGHRPHVIFTDLEEVGGIGANDIIKDYNKCPFKDCRALVQLDRMGENDCVFYSCDNKDFTKYIEGFGFEESWGTFSDISILAPAWKVAAVNLSSGYLDEHSYNERLVCSWCDATIDKVENILEQSAGMPFFKYKMRKVYQYSHSYHITGGGIPKDRCLICDRKLKAKNRHLIADEEFPYYVCDSCYQTYYTDVEELFSV